MTGLVVFLPVLFPLVICSAYPAKCSIFAPQPPLHRYHQPGDAIIGAIVLHGSIISDSQEIFTAEPPSALREHLVVIPKNYQHILALEFAINEINENSQLLPNFTLGFQIYDSYDNARRTFHATMLLVSVLERFVPNYVCNIQNNLSAVIGGLESQISLHVATVLDTYKIPQLIYGTAPVMDDKNSSFYQMLAQETIQYMGILYLMLYFKWTWIGLLVMDDDNGERVVQTLFSDISKSGICVAFVIRIPKFTSINNFDDMLRKGGKIYDKIMGDQSNVLVLWGDSYSTLFLRWLIFMPALTPVTKKAKGVVWIITAQIELTSLAFEKNQDADIINGALAFTVHSNEIPGFKPFLQSRNPYSARENGFLIDFWQQAFGCSFSNTTEDKVRENICTGEEKLESLPGSMFEMNMTSHSYSVYNAVYAVAHALDALSSYRFKHRDMSKEGVNFHSQDAWQLHHFLKYVSLNNTAGDKISFNHRKKLVTGLDIMNWIVFPNQTFEKVIIGRMNIEGPPEQALTIYEDAITWNSYFNQTRPDSACSKSCQPGSSKQVREGEPFCCYNCIPCPEGKISDQKDSIECYKCESENYPSKRKDLCIPRSVTFLSYKEALGFSFACFSLSFSLATTLVLGIFIKYRHTPIVRANNQNLTYMLLISLLLCFLCALLFLEKPQKVLCVFRQPAFGIIFSVAISCVLAKTITVVVAFMATHPGSKMKKWVGKWFANSIILFCSIIQVAICAVWLLTYPPFPDINTDSVAEEILLECNEGTGTLFYGILGYLGFLAVASFVVAFFARKLPDSFNEAKFITFSMLVFCIVWLCFIPTYLSSKGKSMVAVEIFSILASGVGLLSFIFFPKCYVIMWKPELNNKEQLIRRKKLKN